MANSHVEDTTPLLRPRAGNEQYSIFTGSQKRLIIVTAALASSFSPLSANIYYPALNALAKDLGVSPSQINLTITTYMICQGLAPTFMGSLADQTGRRPAYICCFVIYIGGNIALALQHRFAALLILRAVQSCGSSGTVALASAVAADIITSAERGTYMGLASLGNILAPSFGPILGGLLSQYLGWQAVFWFLSIAAAAFFVPFLLFFPETCRTIVRDGSNPPSGWNRSLWDCMRHPHAPLTADPAPSRRGAPNKVTIPTPWASLRLLFHRPTGLVLLANGFIFASYYAVTTGIPARFQALYGLRDFGIGLCFIPAGLGSLFSATANGVLVDWNYRRMRAKAGHPVRNNQKADMIAFPIEQARLQVGVPMMLLAAGFITIYGNLIAYEPPLWATLFMLFTICFCITAAYNVMNVLIVDLHYTTPATAMAANNFVRCFLGAGAAAAVNPLIGRLGVRCTYTLVSSTLAGVSPLLLAVYWKGWAWRRAQLGLPQGRP